MEENAPEEPIPSRAGMAEEEKGEGETPPVKLPALRRKPRHREWTRAKMVTFLRELPATQSVAVAAKAVGMSRTACYDLRNRMQGTPFSLGWEVAVEMGFHQLAQAVMDRAVNGVEVEHWYHGELIGTSRQYDNRLAQWVLENPWKVGRHQVAREYSGQNLDALLERIECASLEWEDDEHIPGPAGLGADPEDADTAENRFEGRLSWYMADAAERVRKRGYGR